MGVCFVAVLLSVTLVLMAALSSVELNRWIGIDEKKSINAGNVENHYVNNDVLKASKDVRLAAYARANDSDARQVVVFVG